MGAQATRPGPRKRFSRLVAAATSPRPTWCLAHGLQALDASSATLSAAVLERPASAGTTHLRSLRTRSSSKEPRLRRKRFNELLSMRLGPAGAVGCFGISVNPAPLPLAGVALGRPRQRNPHANVSRTAAVLRLCHGELGSVGGWRSGARIDSAAPPRSSVEL